MAFKRISPREKKKIKKHSEILPQKCSGVLYYINNNEILYFEKIIFLNPGQKMKLKKIKNTPSDYNPMTTSQVYIRNISDYSLLTADEEVTLANIIRHGTPEESLEAKKKLVQANLRLVVKITHEFMDRGLSKHDLISEGNIGLMTAAEKFDPSFGVKFSTYSIWWIKQSMRRAIADQSRTIRIPIQSLDKINRIQKAERELIQKLGRIPTNREISELSEISERTIKMLRNASVSTSSLNAQASDEMNLKVQDMINYSECDSPEEQLQESEQLEQLRLIIDELDDQEQQVIRMRYGIGIERPMTLEEVGDHLGCTRERVRQIQSKALAKLQLKRQRIL